MEFVNYFKIKDVFSLEKGYVLLILTHEYGSGPDVRLPMTGVMDQFVKGRRFEIVGKMID